MQLLVRLVDCSTRATFAAPAVPSNPLRYLWLIAYFFMLSWDMLKAAMDSLLRLMTPGDQPEPLTLEIETSLENPAARSILGMTISLLPRTLSVSTAGNVGGISVLAAGENVDSSIRALKTYIDKYEKMLKKVFA